MKVKQLRVSRDGTFYPRERLEIDWEKNDYAEAYKSYQKVCESNGNNEPILDMTALKSPHKIDAIDLSAQKETIKSNRVDTSLDTLKEERVKKLIHIACFWKKQNFK